MGSVISLLIYLVESKSKVIIVVDLEHQRTLLELKWEGICFVIRNLTMRLKRAWMSMVCIKLESKDMNRIYIIHLLWYFYTAFIKYGTKVSQISYAMRSIKISAMNIWWLWCVLNCKDLLC